MSQAFDTELGTAYSSFVAAAVPNMPQPLYRERADSNNVFYAGFDPVAWRDEIAYPLGASGQPTGVKVHEHGHCFAQHLGRWYPGGWAQARVDWLVYHGASPNLVQTHEAALWECFAEHFAGALVAGYDYTGYPQYRGLVPFRSAADARSWLTIANGSSEVNGVARMQPRVLAVQVDELGDTPKPDGLFVSGVSGLRPGTEAQGIATRAGFVGSEAVLGDFQFDTDTASQAYGKLHVRGAWPRGTRNPQGVLSPATIYVKVSASQ